MKSALALSLILAACGDDSATSYDPPTPEQLGGCDGTYEKVPVEAGQHVSIGTSITWSTNPPATGAHYPIWAGWDRHYRQLDRGYYVHNLEHGGIVLLYNCPQGCPDVVDNLLAVVRDAAVDPTCEGVVKHRMIVAADSLLPDGVQVAAVAWDRVYTASCFDPYVATFAATRYRTGPEDTCADGNPMTGSLIVP